MKKHRKSRLITTVFLLAALGGIPAMIGFVNRSVSENPIFLGLSPARLFVFIGMVLATVAFFLLSLFTRKKELVDFPISRKHFTVFTTSFLVLMVISYLLCFVPRYNLGLYADLLENLRPIFFWALGIFLLFILAFCIGQFGLHPDFLLSYLTVHRRTWVTSLAAAGFMIVIAGAGIALKVLEYRKEDFWYGAGESPCLFGTFQGDRFVIMLPTHGKICITILLGRIKVYAYGFMMFWAANGNREYLLRSSNKLVMFGLLKNR